MTTTKKSVAPILFALALAIGSAACGSDASGDQSGAYLTIQGDSSLFLEPGYQRDLAVRYHDGQGNPLTGEVSFEIIGDPKGSSINKNYSATDQAGDARFQLFAGEFETVFRVKATADFAASVEWTVSVSEGAVARDLDIRGTYELDSDFDVINGLPGEVGDIANTFADMTDGPYDPATYVLDKMLEGESSTIASIVNATRPALDGIINDAITDASPEIVNDLLELGSAFGQVSREFGIISQMKIAGDSIEDNKMNAVHTINAFAFNIDADSYIFTMQELGSDIEVIENISIGRDATTGKVEIDQHTVPVNYGGFLALALEEVIVPRIDPSANSLKDLLSNAIDCESIGQSVADFVGLFGPSLYEGACTLGIEAASSIILEELRGIDEKAQVNMLINGVTSMKDPSGDGKADKMTKGNWTGAMEYAGELGDMAEANPFTGERMSVTQ
jgi:hypothetical protein